MAKKKVPKMKISKEVHKGLRGVLTTLNTDVIKALDIKEAKKSLEEKVRQLINEEIELKEVVAHLKVTKEKLQSNLKNKESEMKRLQSRIGNLKGSKASLESEKLVLNEQVKNLKVEKEQMSKSLEKTNDLLTMLKQDIAQFDEEIRR
jgi:chromosome segregation ATPase